MYGSVTAQPEILWLGQPDCCVRALVGGKVAHLSALMADFQIPPGFCVTTAAFDHVMAGDRLVGEAVSAAQLLPSALHDALIAAYRALAEQCGITDPPAAVRSSGLDEDGRRASFAGQHVTYLHVVGGEAIADAVVRCWASAHSSRARAYRRQQGLADDRARLAVLVQQLIPADVSAVVFSANPVTGDRGEVLINTSWGLGESLVTGMVIPDIYTVRKADLEVISHASLTAIVHVVLRSQQARAHGADRATARAGTRSSPR